jgi:predicted GIY-YIG superfamily endonuclease
MKVSSEDKDRVCHASETKQSYLVLLAFVCMLSFPRRRESRRLLAIEKWERPWKLRLIEGVNPEWKDLYNDLFEVPGFPPSRE